MCKRKDLAESKENTVNRLIIVSFVQRQQTQYCQLNKRYLFNEKTLVVSTQPSIFLLEIPQSATVSYFYSYYHENILAFGCYCCCYSY